ncbi:MAG: dockerin type I domain-containing protein [Ruminococcus sp.]|nr:dockerin type I domain-containing protein [Ruminococcus sp.]
MKKCLFKKIPAIFIAVAILFSTVFTMNIAANATSSFTPRLSEPAKDNKYYYSNDNIYYKYGYGMPNCTAYAYGRAYEILGTEPKLCPYSAYQWYDYNIQNNYYAYGSTPKLGAIACWYYYKSDGTKSGHVAVVENIENDTITFSNSAWGWLNFYITTADISDPKAGESKWEFQGYIYIGEFISPEIIPSTYKTGIYKSAVGSDSYLNMRNGAGTGYDPVAAIPDNTELTITQTQYSNCYNWGYTEYKGKSGWVALEFCELITEFEISTLIGDVNNDGKVNISDASMIQRYLCSQVEFDDNQIAFADFNGNGKVTIDDITALQRFCAE